MSSQPLNIVGKLRYALSKSSRRIGSGLENRIFAIFAPVARNIEQRMAGEVNFLNARLHLLTTDNSHLTSDKANLKTENTNLQAEKVILQTQINTLEEKTTELEAPVKEHEDKIKKL